MYLFKKKDLHSSSTVLLSHLAGWYFVSNLGIRWQLEIIKSSGIISDTGPLFFEAQATEKRPKSECGVQNGVNHST